MQKSWSPGGGARGKAGRLRMSMMSISCIWIVESLNPRTIGEVSQDGFRRLRRGYEGRFACDAGRK